MKDIFLSSPDESVRAPLFLKQPFSLNKSVESQFLVRDIDSTALQKNAHFIQAT